MTNKDEELLSKTIMNLRFPLTVGIIFLHNNMETINIQGHCYRYETTKWLSTIIELCSVVLADICVPLFFFISGFLFFNNTKFGYRTFVEKIKRRYQSLFIPYIIWNFIGFIILLIELHPWFSSIFPQLKGYQVNIETFLSYFWIAELPISMNGPSNPIDTPLWFVRDLMILGIFTPLLFWLIEKTRELTIVVLCTIWFFSLGKYFGLPFLSHQSIFFFPLGAYFSINNLDFIKIFRRLWAIPYIYILLLVIELNTFEMPYKQWIHYIGILLGMISIIQLVSKKSNCKIGRNLEKMSGTSFFIFASHNLFMGKFMKVVVMITQPQSPYSILLIYFCIPIVTILFCLLSYRILYTISPLIARTVTGGR